MGKQAYKQIQNTYGTHLYNNGWEFVKLPISVTIDSFDEQQPIFTMISIPHDWLIWQADNLYEDGSGWYRKYQDWQREEDMRLVLRFEGVYMDSTIYINREKAAEWKYGYSTFEVDITAYLKEGQNEILVRVAHQAPNSRWYSGAGIYRDVWLKVQHQSYLISDGSYITVKKQENQEWQIDIQTELCVSAKEKAGVEAGVEAGIEGGVEAGIEAGIEGGVEAGIEAGVEAGEEAEKDAKMEEENSVTAFRVEYELWDMQTGKRTAFASGEERVSAKPQEREGYWLASVSERVWNPGIWDVKSPVRYRIRVLLMADGKLWQEEFYTIGFRTIAFSPESGFLLNNRKLKLNGVCEHHDLGCLGAAYHSGAMRRKMEILREMGVNALRLTHNMPAPDVMELADEYGMLVVSEAFDMWERSKTPFDYARFFPEWYDKDVASWVRRDRNHPSLIMWSIGNEIYDTHISERGQELTRVLCGEVRKHDPLGNACITIGSNYMPWENAKKCADIIKLAGYNYAEKYYDAHHLEHPDWIIYGSETASTVQSRGVYHFPYSRSVLADADSQCSALGNSTTSWGAPSSESCIIAERDHEFSCGQFLWTGFDYIGEPTPYHTRNSYFGQVDTAGFPKDSYYIYQAEWTDYKERPMVHLFPYWDFNEGQLIDIRVCSNAPKVALFLNGECLGSHEIDHKNGRNLLGHWQIPYTPGELKACAYDCKGSVIAVQTRHSFGEAAAVVMRSSCTRLDRQGLAFIEISAEDTDGNPVENASNRIYVRVLGPGYLVGLDNGDSTDTDGYKTNSKKLFNGKLLAVAAPGMGRGSVIVEAVSSGLTGARIEIPTDDLYEQEGMEMKTFGIEMEEMRAEAAEDIPVRAVRLFCPEGTRLNEAHREVAVSAVICPPGASDRKVVWCAVDDGGIPSSLAEVKADGTQARVTAKSDGNFRLRCMSESGSGQIRIISELNFEVCGLGKAWLDPYRMISGGLYDYSRGAVGNGNEHGVATARDGETQIGFHGIDFGEFGSDEITLPIFALTDEEYPIQIWEGMPGEAGSSLVGEVIYRKPSVWNVYQEETYHLNRRLQGVTGICFVVHQKIHLKGFYFKRLKKAYQRLKAVECTSVYGDSFQRTDSGIKHIGNNVTIQFDQMDLGEPEALKLIICGYTPLEKNAIQLRFASGEGEYVQLLEFEHRDQVSQQEFQVENRKGYQSLSFVFLPGSDFDFCWFQFIGSTNPG